MTMRMILQKHVVDCYMNVNDKTYKTIEFELPEAERLIKEDCGSGPMGFNEWTIIGVEVSNG